MNRPDQLRSHLALARENGLTQEELIEAITHLAFYAGWPSAITAVSVAKEVFQEEVTRERRDALRPSLESCKNRTRSSGAACERRRNRSPVFRETESP